MSTPESPDLQRYFYGELQAKRVRWLWPGWIPYGFLTVLAGDQGVGKSTIMSSLAAAVTRGDTFPDDSTAPRGGVAWHTTEESVEHTNYVRFLAHGGDPWAISGFKDLDPSNPAAIAQLEADRADHGWTLLIIDPIVTLVEGLRDEHAPSAVRRRLKPWIQYAMETGIALVGITHFAKRSKDLELLERVIGSGAYTQNARMVLIACEDRTVDDPHPGTRHRRLIRAKSSLGPDGNAYRYTIRPTLVEHPTPTADDADMMETTRLLWGDILQGHPQELFADAGKTPDQAQGKPTQTEIVIETLRALLDEHPRAMVSKDRLFQRLGRQGHVEITDHTVKRAIKILGWSPFKPRRCYTGPPGTVIVPSLDDPIPASEDDPSQLTFLST